MNRMIVWTLLMLLGFHAIAHAGIDKAGTAWFDFVVIQDSIPESIEDITEGARPTKASAYMSTDASHFGETGVMILAGFQWESPDGPRDSILLLDLDVRGDPGNGDIPMHRTFIKATYQETWAGELLFESQMQIGNVWIDELVYDDSDEGAIRGAFELVFTDPQGIHLGCRAFLRGEFATNPTSSAIVIRPEPDQIDPHNTEYVEYETFGGVSYHDEYYEVQGCDCGGFVADEQGCQDDTSDEGCDGDWDNDNDSGCEGDTTDEDWDDDTGAGCEGDTTDEDWDDDTDFGCEGDTMDDDWDDDTGSGCEGDSDDDYSGDKTCSHVGINRGAPPKKRTRTFFWALNRLLPQLLAVFLILLRRAKT